MLIFFCRHMQDNNVLVPYSYPGTWVCNALSYRIVLCCIVLCCTILYTPDADIIANLNTT